MSNASGNLRVSGNTNIVGNIDISGNINCYNTISFSKINLKNQIIQLNNGFFYNYASGWLYVQTETIYSVYTLNHNLNLDMTVFPIHLKVIFADKITNNVGPQLNTNDVIIDITGQNMNIAGEVGYSIRYLTYNSLEIKFGHQKICVVSEGQQYFKGYFNLFLYK
jgi:hypothetical protein